jgi:hypothetical protein
VGNPGYSGILKRRYDRPDEKDAAIAVALGMLDAVLADTPRLGLVKIDVEGAELLVLRRARRLLERFRRVVVFEFGLGAADCYGADGSQMHAFFDALGMDVWSLPGYVQCHAPLSCAAVQNEFERGVNYYFVAAPGRRQWRLIQPCLAGC